MPNFLDDEGRCRCYLRPEDPGHKSDCIYRDRPERADALEAAAREIAERAYAGDGYIAVASVLAIMRRHGLRGPETAKPRQKRGSR